jgi:hypothetical protein
MKTKLILGAAVLAVAACGGSGEKAGGNGSATSAGSGGGPASGVSLQPGEWEMKTEVLDFSAEGMPPGLGDSIKAQAGGTKKTCITPEEAKGPSPDKFGQNNGGNCKTEDFDWSGGRIKGRTTCSGGAGSGKAVVSMEGTYGAQNIDMKMKSETDVAGKTMSMELRVTGHRTGECTAASEEG